MKILYINALYSPMIKGGAEISLKLIVEGMQRKGHEVAVLSLSPDAGMKTETVDGVKVYRAGLKNIYWPFADHQQPTLKRLAWHYKDRYNAAMRPLVTDVLMKERPDVVSCHNLVGWSAAVWDEVKSHSIPIVQVLHDMYLLCANSEMYKNDADCADVCLTCKMLRSAHQKKSLQVDAVVGISKSILGRFEKEGYFAKAEKYVIHNTRFVPSPGVLRVRRPDTLLRIGYLGTLLKKKGVEWLIKSFKEVDIDATLLIGGRGHDTYERELRLLAFDERIEFLGHTQAETFFQRIDVLVVPSLWQEPLGMVVIEALANHVPVIANRKGGLQETVIDRVNGLFCDDKTPSSLENAMKELFYDEDLYNRLSASARGSVEQILDRERMISAYDEVINSVTQPTA